MTMTIEEAKLMEGTEFIYVFEDGDTIPAYVKKVDIDTGQLTCFSLDSKTTSGWIAPKTKDTLPDGTYCVCTATNIRQCLEKLEQIATGKYTTTEELGLFGFDGCVF